MERVHGLGCFIAFSCLALYVSFEARVHCFLLGPFAGPSLYYSWREVFESMPDFASTNQADTEQLHGQQLMQQSINAAVG
jgi:hypothetical protein